MQTHVLRLPPLLPALWATRYALLLLVAQLGSHYALETFCAAATVYEAALHTLLMLPSCCCCHRSELQLTCKRVTRSPACLCNQQQTSISSLIQHSSNDSCCAVTNSTLHLRLTLLLYCSWLLVLCATSARKFIYIAVWSHV